jgi:hypothetical protein
MSNPEEARLRCKFFTLTRQLVLPLVPSQVTEKHIEKLTKAAKDDPDFDTLMDMLIGVTCNS